MGLLSSIGDAFSGLGGPLISGAASLAGGLLGANAEQSAISNTSAWNQAQLDFANKQLGVSQNQFETLRNERLATIQNRVWDARQAGIHPLYALGASPSTGAMGTAGSLFPGQSRSGNALGEGIAAAGAALGRGVQGKRMAEANIRQAEAQADLAEMEVASKAKRIEQDFNVSRGAVAERIAAPGTPLTPPVKRPTVEKPNIDAPFWITYQRKDGTTGHAVNPELALDEVGQLIWAFREGKHLNDRAGRGLRDLGRAGYDMLWKRYHELKRGWKPPKKPKFNAL